MASKWAWIVEHFLCYIPNFLKNSLKYDHLCRTIILAQCCRFVLVNFNERQYTLLLKTLV